jgi:hypothetical protein
METSLFIGLDLIQSNTSIRLDCHINTLLEEHQKFDGRVLCGKQTPVQPGVLLSNFHA